ncbi:MAG: site-specific integrase [Desulfobacca sp.]|nr:site-specific integrase [Desulfobacca sp.]
MAILAECPWCHKKQSIRNRTCTCGNDLMAAKRTKKVRYWVSYRLPGGKQRREPVSFSIEEARAAEGKRKAQKYENPSILEKVPAERMTYDELAAWYLNLPSVKAKKSVFRDRQCLQNFCDMFGSRIVSTLKPMDLEQYQQTRAEAGRAAATIDMELSIAKTMINRAFDNDLVNGSTVKAFRRVRRKLKKAANARRRTLSLAEYVRLLQTAPPHLKAILTVAYNTGMRVGELRTLQWQHVDREAGLIRLTADMTKEGRSKIVPINHHVKRVLEELPRVTHHDYVFNYKGEPIKSEGGLKNSFRTACRKAGLTCGRDVEGGIIFHDIRRTVKTNMVNAGVDHVHRDLILGHSLKGMDVHYIAPSEEDLKQAMDRYTAWLDAEIQSVDQNVDHDRKKG